MHKGMALHIFCNSLLYSHTNRALCTINTIHYVLVYQHATNNNTISFIQSQEGQTPLLIAVRKGNVVLARELLEAGANPNHMEMVSVVL